MLLEDFNIRIGKMNILVKKGTVTDFASVPKIIQPFIQKVGKHSIASMVHDYLYSKYNDTGINKTLADKIFLYLMKQSGVGLIKRTLMYNAVVMFGHPFWQPKIENEGYKDVAMIDKSKNAKEYYNKMKELLGDI